MTTDVDVDPACPLPDEIWDQYEIEASARSNGAGPEEDPQHSLTAGPDTRIGIRWTGATVEAIGGTADHLPAPVVWADLFAAEPPAHDWLVEDFWPEGRQIHVVAAAKTGKSLLALWVAYRLGIGRDPFTDAAVEPRNVMYLDMEMTEADVLERLQDMGATPEELDRLAYFLLPALPPLNSAAGAARLLKLIDRHQPAAIVLDTLSRVVEGEENAADTIQGFYNHTGVEIKRRGIGLCRLDHEGFKPGHGRGSSSKAEDVDVTWLLKTTSTKNHSQLKIVSKRISWLPDAIDLTQTTEPLGFTRGLRQYTERALEIARQLERLGVDHELGRAKQKTAAQALDPMFQASTEDLAAAVAYRKKNRPK